MNRRTMKAALLALAASALMTSAATAAETIRIAGSLRPGSMMDGIIQTFITNFNKEAGPDYRMEYQLVANDQEMTQQVIRGRLEIGTTGLAGAAVSIPPGAVLSMPYLWDNDAQRRWGTDNVVRPVLESIFAGNGLVLIGVGDAGWSNIFCKGTCDTPDELRGRRFRVPPAASARAFWEKVGVNGVQLSLPDFFTGLEQGMIEGGDLPLTFFVTTPAAQFARRYVLTRAYHHEQVFFVNKRFYEKLPPRIQALLKSAMPSTDEMRRRQDEDETRQAELFTANGGTVVQLSAEQRAVWAQRVGNVHDSLLAALPGRARELYDAVQDAKRRYAARTN
ncbi:TRAP transporter substrate-binding protein [Phreatobacter sp. AB_2022a]|uniref:TRAP transporter substrate-binding protein n=1 Tax=Phreatobacter sp. AB_2022a TaxID=3003134 RepID=UPI00056EA9D0|nr:TRAP transporter substrate-binding protein DctP [Phreatobacter sp. AB_2022a]MCZ0734795.1 TRAP transporter substrate-binding protein DctP [Phreatobacter sp. AB_2022a]CEJ10821.1 2,3-diketo-L-gulonate-binding periplasmic protein YiaO precursor [bacterium YEK0313]